MAVKIFLELIRYSDDGKKLKQIYQDMQAHIAFWFDPAIHSVFPITFDNFLN